MSESKQISVYNNETSIFGSREEKYTLVNFPLRTKVSTSMRSSSLGGSMMKSKQQMRVTQPTKALENLKNIKIEKDREREQ